MSDLIRCPSCKGIKKIIGLGYIKHDCPTCDGVGSVVKPLKPVTQLLEGDDGQDTENHAEQNHVEDSEDAQTEKTVDTSAANRRKAKRQRFGKAAVGTR